ncbi:hypothetical protein AS034_20265 [[Bacillus] enclensis]|uniref:Uncharacterized protein n=1 Tax=[Bacillus] enclensis TaxID=1402860 RepID=A0A0V8H6F9_9BACI|nr:hypothetical protein AS034_20265 [[Bacillus] enclensis]SCC35179.1 hypothetical protein GA0061094_4200 [[Bacillus] enclensis]
MRLGVGLGRGFWKNMRRVVSVALVLGVELALEDVQLVLCRVHGDFHGDFSTSGAIISKVAQ